MVSYPDSDAISLHSHHASSHYHHRSSSRRAPSVASSHGSTVRTHHRHHRHARSHAGGSSGTQTSNEFPWFTHTGDVEIVITSPSGRREARYLLHKLILTQCSGFFEAGTSEEWSGSGEAVRGRTGLGVSGVRGGGEEENVNGPGTLVLKKRWRYELDWGEEGDIPMLVQKESTSLFGGNGTSPRPPPVRNKPTLPPSQRASNGGFFRTMANFSALNISGSQTSSASTSATSQAEDDIFRAYDNLLRIFYNYPPALDPMNIANAYVECKSLLQVADMYDALAVIGPRVDHHLLRFQARLWKQIAKYPPSYLKLGYLARSRAIFSEALIHVVGQWPAGLPQLRGQVPGAVMDLIEDKADELDELKAKVEARLWRLTLTTSRGERVGPSNAWLDWLAMSLWRQWFAEQTTPAPTGILKSPGGAQQRASSRSSRIPAGAGGAAGAAAAATSPRVSAPPPPPLNTGRVFRLIGAGGNAYLAHPEPKKFLKLSTDLYTRENMRRFERRLEEVKNLARDAVQPLMRNFLELDVSGGGEGTTGGLPYLTCTRIGEGDWPWEDE